jgi:hypothetical protein
MHTNIARLGEGGAVEIPSGDDTQPGWLLFEADIAALQAAPQAAAPATTPPT